MKGAILDKGEKYYTDLSKIFSAINGVQNKYNWLITDCECYPQNDTYNEMFSREYCWLTGEELSEIVKADDFQWIWAVISGFDKDVLLDDILKFDLPYADGYTEFWKNPISLQNPLAKIEIVPWDSSLTLIISKEDKIVDDFLKNLPLSQNLENYNNQA